MALTKRYPCVRCRARIDVDLHFCPVCSEREPLRYVGSRRITARVMFVVFVAVAASAWFVLV